MIRLLFLVILSLFSSFIFGQKIKFNEIKLIDTATSHNVVFISKTKRIANYIPLYAGDLKKEIKVDYNFHLREKWIFGRVAHKYKGGIFDTTILKIDIFVDTNYTITSKGLEYGNLVAGYPVFILNKNHSSYIMSYWFQIDLILQAKTKKGEWVDVEKRYIYDCTTGMSYLQLKPKELLVTSCLITHGNFKTELRLRYHSNYSNEFEGYIFEEQFIDKNEH
jgi:hypothetical protein